MARSKNSTVTEANPNATDATANKQHGEQLDLKQLAREKGDYLVFPDVKYPEIEEFEHYDPGHRADPKKASLINNAEKIVELTPHIGTEVHGIQLSKLTDQQKDDLALLVAERGVVFFPKQDINVYQMIELGRHYGPLHIHPTQGHPKGLPEVNVVYYDRNSSREFVDYFSAGDSWHSDVPFEKQPPGTTFFKVDLLPPGSGGDTLWTSNTVAYDRLTPAMQKFIEGLEAVNTGKFILDMAVNAGNVIRRKHYQTVHPVVRTHPVTKRKSLFVNPLFTERIVGMAKRESEAVLKFLYSHMEAGHDFQVRYRWTEDTVAVWDNRVTNHNPMFDYLDLGPRHAYRITPQAEKPYFEKTSKPIPTPKTHKL